MLSACRSPAFAGRWALLGLVLIVAGALAPASSANASLRAGNAPSRSSVVRHMGRHGKARKGCAARARAVRHRKRCLSIRVSPLSGAGRPHHSAGDGSPKLSAPVQEITPAAPSEPAPAPSEPAPAPSEPAPTPSEPAPTPSEPAPAPSEPAPAPSEPAPTPSEPTPEPAPTSTGTTTTSEPSPAPQQPEHFRFFSSTSFWNTTLSASAPLDPGSAEAIRLFNAEIVQKEAEKKGPMLNTTSWSVPLYTVPAGQPTVKVKLMKTSAALQAAWEAVPLPAGAHPATGTDKHLVVWQPSANKLWEFWKLEEGTEGWHASWGGAIEHVSANSGAYGPDAWSGGKTGWGASATSLSIAGGLVTLEDLEKGVINHALAMAIPKPRQSLYASPAERTDGWSTELLSIPEGAHLRLDPKLDLASLNLPKLTLMLAEAAQKYGIFVRDTAAKVVFYAQDSTPTGTNPYTGTSGYYEGKTPTQIMAAFPWSHLQLLRMELL
jgi:hypothetical protein